MKRAVILGGSGFIGRGLSAELIARGWSVSVLDPLRPADGRVSWIRGDARDLATLGRAVRAGDLAVHLVHAGVPADSADSEEKEERENVIPFAKLLAALAEGPRRPSLFVYSSTGGQIYGQAETLPIREDHPCRPISNYGRAKLKMEKLARDSGLPALVIRIANPYGPYQELTNRHGAVPHLFQSIIDNTEFIVYGGGSTVRDYLYIDDAAKAVAALAESGARGQTVNVGTGTGTSLSQLVALAEKVSHGKIKTRDAPIRESDVEKNALDVGRLKELTGFEPQTSLEQGLRLTWEHMKKNEKRDVLVALAVLAAFLAVRGPALFEPFILPFETAFQEAIALHHLENGIAANNFLPVFAMVEGKKFHHTAHPPLLHAAYALLYQAAGVREWVTRFLSLGLYFLAVLLWRALLGKDARRGWFVFPLAFCLPIPFLLCTTTNYETMSLFFVSLIGWLVLRRKAGLAVLVPAAAAGMLVDWPVYLAVPALLALLWRDPVMRRRLSVLLGFEVLFFGALQGYQYAVAGEAAFFSHAPDRANPLALFSPATYGEIGGHFIGVVTAPIALVIAAALIRSFLETRRHTREKKGVDDPARALQFFALFPLLLILSAPGLVSRHYVHLLYLAPLCVLALRQALVSTSVPHAALAAALALMCARDCVIAQHRNPAYFGMADRMKSAGIETAFASSAVGAWRYYDFIETVHPLSAAGSDWIKDNRPDLVHLDLRHGEVEPYRRSIEGADYGLVFSMPGERVYLRAALLRRLPRYLSVEGLSTFVMAGPGRGCRSGTWIQSKPYYGANIDNCRIPLYGIHQPPGPDGAAITVSPGPGTQSIRLSPAIVHALPAARSDGVMFVVLANHGNNKGPGLIFARFEPGKTAGIPRSHELGIAAASSITLATTPGPRNDPAFDDAYWLEPIIVGREQGEQ